MAARIFIKNLRVPTSTRTIHKKVIFSQESNLIIKKKKSRIQTKDIVD